jgi:uncharacterized ubiquitin-like protein YukD
MQMLLITVAGPQQSIDLQVPGELPISDLLPTLLEVCCSPAEATAPLSGTSWQVVYSNKFLPLDRALSELAVPDGAILHLQNQAAPLVRALPAEQQRPRQFMPRNISPDRNTGGIGVQWSKA